MSHEYYPSEEEKKSEKKDTPKKMKAFLISKQNHKGHTKCTFIDLYEFNRSPYYECLLAPSQTKDLHHGSIIETDINFKNITEIHMEHSYRIGVILGKDKNSLFIYDKKYGERKIDIKPYTEYAERGDKLLLNRGECGQTYVAHNITTAKMKHEIDQLTR